MIIDNHVDDNYVAYLGVKADIDRIYRTYFDVLQRRLCDPFSKHNIAFLSENKEGLCNRNYNNVSVDIARYIKIPFQTIIDEMDAFITNLSTLNLQTIQSFKTQDDVYKKLFPFIVDEEYPVKLSQQIINYYWTGTIKTPTPRDISIGGDELKNFIINVMIPYCEDYQRNILTLSTFEINAMDKLGVIFKNETHYEVNTNPQTRWVLAAVKIYMREVLINAYRRYDEYLNILSVLNNQ